MIEKPKPAKAGDSSDSPSLSAANADCVLSITASLGFRYASPQALRHHPLRGLNDASRSLNCKLLAMPRRFNPKQRQQGFKSTEEVDLVQ